MRTINMHEAKTHLSKLVDEAAKGEPFVIAKAGKPMVVVKRIESHGGSKPKRLGFLPGAFNVPDDFDEMGKDDIAAMFGNLVVRI